MAGGNLNVIFHGLFAFVVHEDCLEVLMPEVPAVAPLPAHQYSATTVPGAAGTALAQGTSYQLRGVSGSDGVTRFPQELFPVVERYHVIDRTATRLHGSIYMPFPDRITGLRKISVGRNKYFGGRAGQRIKTAYLPLVYVLTYGFTDPADIWLDAWQVPAAAGNGNLHVFAEPAAAPAPVPAPAAPPPAPAVPPGLPANYATLAFQRLVRLFPALDLDLVAYGWEYPERPSGILGVDDDRDQRSLIELGWTRAFGAAVLAPIPPPRPATPLCISLVVDNA